MIYVKNTVFAVGFGRSLVRNIHSRNNKTQSHKPKCGFFCKTFKCHRNTPLNSSIPYIPPSHNTKGIKKGEPSKRRSAFELQRKLEHTKCRIESKKNYSLGSRKLAFCKRGDGQNKHNREHQRSIDNKRRIHSADGFSRRE